MKDFADTAVLVTSDGVRRGKDAIRNFFDGFFKALPKAQWGHKTIYYADNVLFLEWTGDSARASVSDGVDTFLFKDGLIQAETAHYTVLCQVTWPFRQKSLPQVRCKKVDPPRSSFR